MSISTADASSPAPRSSCAQGPVNSALPWLSIKPPCVARRVLPLLPAPGFHMYDPHRNCFLYRPDVRQKLVAAAQRGRAFRSGDAARSGGANAASAGEYAADSVGETAVPYWAPCRCALDAAKLFDAPHDMPNPPLPLSRCELHEVHLSLSPRWQGYPWRLCFDTATDGFSLSSFYRRMEEVEARQSQVKTVAFGIFFVNSREDAPLSRHPSLALVDNTSASSSMNSYSVTPRTSSEIHTFRMAHHARLQRYSSAHSTPPYSVLGCFTPEVPCLSRHAANLYFGSTDTFVFRLSQLSTTPSRGAWMAADTERCSQPCKEAVGEGIGCKSRCTSQAHIRCSNHPEAIVTSVSMCGYKGLGIADDGEAGAPVPLPTHMTIEHPHTQNPTIKTFSSSLQQHGLPLSSNSAPLPNDFNLPISSVSSPTGRQHHRPLPVVPQTPLLEKFSWCGRADNKRFVVCNPHFFAIGGGENGAALYVDETLQYGTTSRWCETFSSPSLTASHIDDGAALPVSPRMRSPINKKYHDSQVSTSSDFSRLDNGLPHTEFTISRVVWFSITEDKRKLRAMNTLSDTGSPEVMHYCGCGRFDQNGDSGATPPDAATATQWHSSPLVHRCDLLPCAAPM